jgi:glutamyl-tRNA reductase
MSGTFKVATISYKNAPLALREKIVMDQADTMLYFEKIKESLDLKEAFLLSTCNRTEIYYKSEKALTRELVKLLAESKGLSANELLVYFEEILNEHNTLKYLFEVSIGVHSQIVGDQQIINQVKTAYQWAIDADVAGPFLHKVLHTIFIANKRVVQETGFRDGAASTTFVTLDLLESFIGMIESPKILVLGLGEIGTDLVKTLFERDYKHVYICNRSFDKAETLSQQTSFPIITYEELNSRLSEFSVVLSSVRNSEYTLNDISAFKKERITYLFDLSIPRSVSPDMDKAVNLVVYSLDEIQKRKDQGLKAREESIPAVKNIITELIFGLDTWSRELAVSPTIQKLKSSLDQIRKEEIDRYSKNLSLKEMELLEKMSNSMVQKILKLPVVQLKEQCKKGDPQLLIDSLNKLFELE